MLGCEIRWRVRSHREICAYTVVLLWLPYRIIASPALIHAKDLTKHFPSANGSDVIAVNKVSFDVEKGEVFGLLGPNGAGKTTTLRMMLGLMQPTNGDSIVNGISVASDAEAIKRQVGFVSTSVGVYQWLTPREMLSFVADLYDVCPEESATRVEELVGLLDMQDYIDRRCGVLSTGQKQRVNLARALIHDPPVMFLDEPTRGLDIVGSQVVFDFIQHLREEDKAVIICTHRLDEAERFADRFGLLHEGRLVQHGTLSDLQNDTGQTTLTEMFIQLMTNVSAESAS